ncbi:MAG: hypothetical protein H0U35_07770 [Sporichthyaceae bacterium]|nr:hypothetical protein [Sporichthyaceae bacterium]
MAEATLTVKRSQVAAAKLRLSLDRRAGRESSAAIRAIASAQPRPNGYRRVLGKD